MVITNEMKIYENSSQGRKLSSRSNIINFHPLLAFTMGHIPTKLHQFLTSSFRHFLRTDSPTVAAKNNTCSKCDWMRSNRLQLSTAKTEILWCLTTRQQNHLPSVAVRVGESRVLPSAVVRDLGVLIDGGVAVRSRVSRAVSGCFAVLQRLRGVERSVSDFVFHSLVVSLIVPRLDYCCGAALAGLPASRRGRLRSVLNSAAGLMHRSSRYEHVAPMLRHLHCSGCGLRNASISS